MADIETIEDWNLQMICWSCSFPSVYQQLQYRTMTFRIGMWGHREGDVGSFPTLSYNVSDPDRIYYKRRNRTYAQGPLTDFSYPGSLDTITMDRVTAEADEYFPEIAQVEYQYGNGPLTVIRAVVPERVYRNSGGKISYLRYVGGSFQWRTITYEMEEQEHSDPNAFVVKTTTEYKNEDDEHAPGSPTVTYALSRWSTIADTNITGHGPPASTDDLTEPFTVRELSEEAFSWADSNSPDWSGTWLFGIPSWLAFRTYSTHLKCQIQSSIHPNPTVYNGDYWLREWDIASVTYNDDGTWNTPGSLTGSDSHTFNRPTNPSEIFTYEQPDGPGRKELYNDRYVTFRSKYGTKPQYIDKPWPP